MAAAAAVASSSGPAMAATGPASGAGSLAKPVQGGRFDFDDGGMYCGGWEDGKAHGHGVCTGLKGQGEYSGSWNYGFEVSGVYTWPGGSTYEGHWQNGKRHGLGVESRGRWIYRGEWTQGFKGRYGVRQSLTSAAKYDGTWANGLQDGYGSETYADGGTYQGQWLRGLRHGYGVRTSAPFGMASRFRPKTNNVRSSTTSLKSDAAASAAAAAAGGHHGHHHQSGSSSSGGGGGGASGAHQLHSGGSLDPAADRDKRLDDGRGGFVLKARSDEPPVRRRSFSERSSTIKKSLFQGLRLKKQHSTGELEKRGTSASIRSTGSSASWMSTESSQSGMTAGAGSHHTDSNASFVAEDEPLDASVTETYMGEWKNDKRAGFGISERSDGLKYEGEWFNNKKYGYGVTTLKDGTKEEGKYKNNVLITSQKKKHLFLIRSAKFRERIEAAVSAAQRASKIALQKADIAISRTSTARAKAELADVAAVHAREDADFAVVIAKQLAPDFQPSSETMRPPLAALSRLATTPALQSAGNKSTYLTANNVQQHDQYGYADGGLAATAAARVEEYASSAGSGTSSLGLGGGSELTRRPSVAIGGVRSPNLNTGAAAAANKLTVEPDPSANVMMMNLMGNNVAYSPLPSNTSRPNSVQQHLSMSMGSSSSSMYAPSNYSSSNNGPMMRKGSLMAQQQQQQFLPPAGLFPQQQQQHQLPYGTSGGYQQMDSGQHQMMYSPSPTLGMNPSMQDDIMMMQSRDVAAASSHGGQMERGRSSLRRGPTLTGGSFSGGGGGYSMESSSHHVISSGGNPSYNFQQAMNDHFDHYKRPPSRDRSRDPSMDRFSRSSRQSSVAAVSRQESALMGVGSRGPSPAPTPTMSGAAVGRSVSRHRPPSSLAGTASPGPNRLSDASINPSSLNDHSLQRRMATPVRETSHHHSTSPGNGSIPGFGGAQQPTNSIEEMLLRQRLGQEIPHQQGSGPKRTESLYISPARKQEKAAPVTSPKRKKSLPGADEAPVPLLSREEASALSSQRREEMRRQVEEAERYRANPLLYFCSPQVKGWFARQQLTIFILFINLSLAFLFFKLLT